MFASVSLNLATRFEKTVTDQLSNTQLELACRLGSEEEILEALEDGADINFNGSTPLFVAIMAGDREVVTVLVEQGADASLFGLDVSEPEEIVEALMKLAPAPVVEDEAGGAEEDPVDGKLARAFDRMIRNHGLAEPWRKGRGSEYAAFRDSLRWIAAEECHAVVDEFIGMVEVASAEIGEEGIPALLEENAARVAELSERYLAAADGEEPRELLKEYLKERKKVA